MIGDPSQFVEAVGASLSADGTVSELRFSRKNKSVIPIEFPTAAAASVLFNIEQALGRLFELQRAMLKGQDPRTFFSLGTKHVVKVQGAIAQGMAIVSFVLKSNVRLDFALDRTRVRELIEWLQEVEAGLDKPLPGRN
jgi:hypothetical protein